MFKKAVQRGRSERRGEAYSLPYVEPLSDVRTKLADFFNILLIRSNSKLLYSHGKGSGESGCRDLYPSKGVGRKAACFHFDRYAIRIASHDRKCRHTVYA